MSRKETKRSPALIIGSSILILLGAWLASLGAMVVERDLALALSAFVGAALLVGSGITALTTGSWEKLKEIIYWLP